MIYRYMFVGYSPSVQGIRVVENPDCYVSLSYKDDMVYLYVESNRKKVDPELLVQGELIRYPDGKQWERAIEIFHYSKPINEQQWKRKIADKEPVVMLNRVKPEMSASYIFYHYQYQEEIPGDGDRYGIIWIFRDLLIFYLEKPEERENEKIEGLLQTQHTPVAQWGNFMQEHFADQWRVIENLDKSRYCRFEENIS